MAASDITLQNLKGSWVLDKSVGDDTDGILKLQGVGWLTRKGIGAATLTLHFTTKTEGSVAHLTMRQTLTGGIPGSTEERVMDWAERPRSNHIYGDMITRSKYIDGVQADGAVQPELTLESKPHSEATTAEVLSFLRSGTPVVSEKDGLKDLYIHDFGKNEKAGWTADQVWSLEEINGERYLIRRVVVVKGEEYELARLAYRFTGL